MPLKAGILSSLADSPGRMVFVPPTCSPSPLRTRTVTVPGLFASLVIRGESGKMLLEDVILFQVVVVNSAVPLQYIRGLISSWAVAVMGASLVEVGSAAKAVTERVNTIARESAIEKIFFIKKSPLSLKSYGRYYFAV